MAGLSPEGYLASQTFLIAPLRGARYWLLASMKKNCLAQNVSRAEAEKPLMPPMGRLKSQLLPSETQQGCQQNASQACKEASPLSGGSVMTSRRKVIRAGPDLANGWVMISAIQWVLTVSEVSLPPCHSIWTTPQHYPPEELSGGQMPRAQELVRAMLGLSGWWSWPRNSMCKGSEVGGVRKNVMCSPWPGPSFWEGSELK